MYAFIYLKNREKDLPLFSAAPLPHALKSWSVVRPKPRARNSIRVSHVGHRNLSTCISSLSPGHTSSKWDRKRGAVGPEPWLRPLHQKAHAAVPVFRILLCHCF